MIALLENCSCRNILTLHSFQGTQNTYDPWQDKYLLLQCTAKKLPLFIKVITSILGFRTRQTKSKLKNLLITEIKMKMVDGGDGGDGGDHEDYSSGENSLVW